MNTEETQAPAAATENAAPAAPMRRGGRGPRRDSNRPGRGPRRDNRRGAETPAEEGPQLMEKTVMVNRCAKVVKGGRRFSFSVLVVVGDQKGKVGIGMGKANEVADAIRKASEAAKRSMKTVTVVNETIPHEIYTEFGGAKIVLKPAASGTGLVASAKVRAVLEAAGVNNVIAKSLGSSNGANVAKATLKALLSMRTADEILSARGKKKKENTL